jgi:hypothetical protein
MENSILLPTSRLVVIGPPNPCITELYTQWAPKPRPPWPSLSSIKGFKQFADILFRHTAAIILITINTNNVHKCFQLGIQR